MIASRSLSTSPKKQSTVHNTIGITNSTSCNVRVVVRIRPLNRNETLHQSVPVITPKIVSSVLHNNALPHQQQQERISPLSPSKSIISSISVGEEEDDTSVTLSTTSSTHSRRSIFQKFRRKPKMNNKKKSKNMEAITANSTETQLQTESVSNKTPSRISSSEPHRYPTICVASNRQYEFDTVYGPETTNGEFYNHCFGTSVNTSNMLNERNSENVNITILAYGMTGTGKTYTMNMNDGVMHHVVRDIFCTKEQTNTTTEAIYVNMSCFEIYADEIRDLLDHRGDTSFTVNQSPLKPKLQLRDHGERIQINGLSEIKVNTTDEVHELLQHAQQQRMTSPTQTNEQSSRSHAIYVFTVTSTSTQPINPLAPAKTTSITWTLVDLAGSERIKDSGVTGLNRKESIHINTDLFVLGKVISSLHEQKVHVPYRDSKLTRILRSSLGGGCSKSHCRTIFIACVSPAEMHIDESLNTLRYAERARSIVNNITTSEINRNDASSMTPEQIIALQEENTILRARIMNLTRRQALNEFNHGVGADRGGIKFASIATKLQLAKEQAASIRQRTALQNKNVLSKTTQSNNIELQALCESLRQEVDFVNSENDILRLQTHRLQDEIKRLRIMKGVSDEPIVDEEDSDNEEEVIDVLREPNDNISSDHEKIRSHAERLLNWADEAIDRNRNSNDVDQTCSGSSSTTSDGTDLRPLRPSENSTCPIFRARNMAEDMENQFYISNMKNMETTPSMNGCPCEESVFSKQPEVIDFYLPKLGLCCSCGRKDTVQLIGSDPCRIENILRDWQVQFCITNKIETAVDLIHAFTQNSNQLAKQMRVWRKGKGMRAVKTKSCSIALRIWARTCKTVIKTMQNQKDKGKISRPEFLDVALSSDTFSVSTLGFCASSIDHTALSLA